MPIIIKRNTGWLGAVQFPTQSNRLGRDGDIIEISTSKWFNWHFWGSLIALAMTIFIANITLRTSIVTLVMVLG